MRILFESQKGDILGYAMRSQKEGHDVKFTCPIQEVGYGIVDKPSGNWQPDLIVYDEKIKTGENPKTNGVKTFGPSRWSGLLETDSSYQKTLVTTLGFENTSRTDGINLYLTGWFNGERFISTYASIVYRRLMSGGAGPDITSTGCVSCFGSLVGGPCFSVMSQLLKPLRKVNHRGVITIHAFVFEGGFGVKNIFCDLGHPTSLVFFENTNLSLPNVILRLLDESSKEVHSIDPWASSLQVSLPPYPYTVQGVSPTFLRGIVPQALKHYWLNDVMSVKDHYHTTGNSGLIGYITARGTSDCETVRRMYRTIKDLNVLDAQYRNDVGRNIQGILSKLKTQGWLN